MINQQAIHHIDALNYIFGPIKKVSSFISKRLNKLEAEDTCVSIIELSDGALCTLEATTAARPKDFEASITVVGEKGMAKIGGIGLNKIDNWEIIKKNAKNHPQDPRDPPNIIGLGGFLVVFFDGNWTHMFLPSTVSVDVHFPRPFV